MILKTFNRKSHNSFFEIEGVFQLMQRLKSFLSPLPGINENNKGSQSFKSNKHSTNKHSTAQKQAMQPIMSVLIFFCAKNAYVFIKALSKQTPNHKILVKQKILRNDFSGKIKWEDLGK